MIPRPLQILALCGSLRAQSSNARLLQVAQQLAPPTLHITFYDDLGALPHFNPDLDGESVPPSVAALRAQLDAADGILICTPEYGHGLPGSFKNALDWTVSSGQWMEKPTLILKSSRSNHAHNSLVEILTTLMATSKPARFFCPATLWGWRRYAPTPKSRTRLERRSIDFWVARRGENFSFSSTSRSSAPEGRTQSPEAA